MANLLEVNVDGTTVYIEAESRYGSEGTTTSKEAIEKAQEAFERAQDTVASVSSSMVRAIKKLDKAVTPNEFQIEFALKFTAEGKAVLTKVGGEATLTITMTYKHDKDEEAK